MDTGIGREAGTAARTGGRVLADALVAQGIGQALAVQPEGRAGDAGLQFHQQVGVLAGSHKLHHLRFAHDQLRTVLDLLVLIRPAE